VRLRRAVFLDRDGVLNRAIMRNGEPCAPRTLDEFEILPGVAGELGRLHEFALIVVTNQSGVAYGRLKTSTLDAMHAQLFNGLPIDDIYTCRHIDEDYCVCRKPKPGMLLKAAYWHKLALFNSFIIGDRWQDVEAGYLAGCRTVFLDRDYTNAIKPTADATVRSLGEAVDWILTAAPGREPNRG
jgi:D-glycero-D-manno-heptose 1,7-bisphosphate phosphatase